MKTIPGSERDKKRLCLKQKDLLNSPSDWHDFIAFVMFKNSKEGVNDEPVPLLINMGDDATMYFLSLLKKNPLDLYVIGHPTLSHPDYDDVMWEIGAIKGNEDQRLYVGGENMRTFLDHHNIFYKTSRTKDGDLLSVTDGLFLKKENEDCRIEIPFPTSEQIEQMKRDRHTAKK